MSVTFAVLKPLRSREVKELQPANISHMFVTFEVLKLLTSRDVNDSHSWNMPNMVVTFEVLKPLRSMDVKDSHSENIKSMSVTFEVFRYEMPVMVVRFSMSANHQEQSVGRALEKEELNTTLVTS